MSSPQPATRGAFFAKRDYRDLALPEWAPTRLRLPSPVLPERPDLVDAYWRAWEGVFAAFRRPPLGSALVSNYLDPGCEGRLSLLEMACNTSFLDLAHDLVPGVRALDNFYAAQHPDGEICRELEVDGRDFEPWVNREGRPLFSRRSGRAADLGRPVDGVPALTLDGWGHPLLPWAEHESYRQTGDASRVAMVWEPLLQNHQAWRRHLWHEAGLAITDRGVMDNSPRNARLACGVDGNAELVLAARCLAALAPVAAREAETAGLRREGLAARRAGRELAAEADASAARIRERMWDEGSGFYYDLEEGGRRGTVPTIAAFWTLLAGVATPAQAGRLAGWLEDPAAFGRPVPVPSLPASAPGYDPRGGAYRGGVFVPFVLMVVRGLRRAGHGDLAHRLAMGCAGAVAAVAAGTGTYWESYAPESPAPGRPARRDVVGSGGIASILFLLEEGVGLRANAPLRELEWHVRTAGACGCERYWFAGGRVDLLAAERPGIDAPLTVTAAADRPFTLRLRTGDRECRVRVSGRQEITLP